MELVGSLEQHAERLFLAVVLQARGPCAAVEGVLALRLLLTRPPAAACCRRLIPRACLRHNLHQGHSVVVWPWHPLAVLHSPQGRDVLHADGGAEGSPVAGAELVQGLAFLAMLFNACYVASCYYICHNLLCRACACVGLPSHLLASWALHAVSWHG